MTIKMLQFFLWYFLLLSDSASEASNVPRISSDIRRENFLDFTVLIQTAVGMGCSGSIISQRHILTTISCTAGDISRLSKIGTFDSHKVLTGKNYYNSIEGDIAYVPLDYPDYGSGDIAVLEFPVGTNLLIKSDIPRGITPVTLAKDYVEKEGDIITIAGWFTKGVYQNASITMDGFGGHSISMENNAREWPTIVTGGPNVIYKNDKWYQVSVSTVPGEISYNTRISSFCNFIEEVTKKEVECETMYPERPAIPSFPPIYKGPSTPPNVFDFVIPFRAYSFNNNETKYGCTATVISPRHLLTSTNCVCKSGDPAPFEIWLNYFAIEEKFYADFRSKSAQKIDKLIVGIAYIPQGIGMHLSLAVIEYPKGTDFGIEPVALDKSYIEVYREKYVIAGYGKYAIKDKTDFAEPSPPLQHMTSIGWYSGNKYEINLYPSALMGDEGGPALIERNGKFYQVGVAIFSKEDKDFRARVSAHCDFIALVTKNEVECESIFKPILPPLPPESPQTESFQENTSKSNLHSKITVTFGILIFIDFIQYI